MQEQSHPLNAIRRMGIVNSLSLGPPPTVNVTPGGDTANPIDVPYLGSAPSVGDVVVMLSVDGDHIVVGTIATTITWIDWPYNTGYTDYLTASYQGAQYTKITGIVYTRGLIKKTTNPWATGNQPNVPLPVGYRPNPGGTSQSIFPVTVCNTGNPFIWAIDNTGNVTVNNSLSLSPVWVSLAGISFPAEV